MPSVHVEDVEVALDLPEIQISAAQVGPYTISREVYKLDSDPAPLFHGLPDDRCQGQHWGYVCRGQITFVFADHEETFTAGDAYYVGPGHTPKLHADSEVMEFSPTDELQATMAVVEANLAATV